MAVATIKGSEILLNSIKYKLRTRVQPVSAWTPPQKLVTGDYTMDTDPNMSMWVVNDQTGGIGIEEMETEADNKRCLWSTCDLRQRGNIVLPRLVSEVMKPATPTAGVSDGSGTAPGPTWANVGNVYDENLTTYSRCNYGSGAGWSDYLELTYTAHNANNLYLIIQRSSAGTDAISVEAYYDSAWNVLENAVGDITWSTTTRNIIPIGATKSVTKIRIRTRNEGGVENTDIYEFSTDNGGSIGAALKATANFNAHLYFGIGQGVWRLSETYGDRIYLLKGALGATITDMIASHGGKLYVAIGDGANYWYMNTSESFAQTVVPGTFLTEWDSKLFITDSAGVISELTDPDAASPGTTAKGSLADNGVADGALTSLTVAPDASGAPIIYAGTKVGLFGHDYTNTDWEQTRLSLPNHPNGGKGLALWREFLYISSGLDVARYDAETPIIDFSKGLSRDAGMINEHAGEIVKFIPAFNELFALVDSSQVTGTGYSTVMSWDGIGWQCTWAGATADDVMTTGVVSSAYEYRFYFDHDSKLYYMALDRNLTNPKKQSSHYFGAAGLHLSPWFNAGWIGDKTAIAAAIFCADLTAAGSETVVLKYRKDYANTDRGTGWNTIDTLVTADNGVSIHSLGSGAGINFKHWQWGLDLARGSTTTLSPNVKWVKLLYRKVPATSTSGRVPWGWWVTLDCNLPYDGRSPEAMLDNIRTCAASGTLITFYYDDTAHYVYVHSVGDAEEETGKKEAGVYKLLLVEP